MTFSDKNIKHEAVLYAMALGLLAEMKGGKALVQMLFENAFSLVEESDQEESKKILKAVELNRGISPELESQEIFQELIADLSKKLKTALRQYYDSDKTWAKKLKVTLTNI
jgi:hypothetical protein